MSEQPSRDYRLYAARTAEALDRLRSLWLERSKGASVAAMSESADSAATAAETVSHLAKALLGQDREFSALIGITCMLPLCFLDAGGMDHIDVMIRDWRRIAAGELLTDRKTYSVDDLRQLLGLARSQTNEYIKTSGVTPAPRGGKNHRYSHVEIVRVLTFVAEHGSTRSVRDKARNSLSNLSKNPY